MIAERLKMADAFVRGGEVALRQIEHSFARRFTPTADPQDFSDFLERETETLPLLDESEFLYGCLAVMAIAGLRTPWLRQQAQFFVEPDGRRGDVRQPGEISDEHDRD